MKKTLLSRQTVAPQLMAPENGETPWNALLVNLVANKNTRFGIRTDAQLILKILDLDFG